MLVWSLEKAKPRLVLSAPISSSTRAMILPWQTGPPMCGQTFSKAVNLPSRQNTPTDTPSTSTTLRPGLGKAAVLPIKMLCIASCPSETAPGLGRGAAAVPHRQIEQADVGRAQQLAHEEDNLRRRDLLDRDRRKGPLLCLRFGGVELDRSRQNEFELTARDAPGVNKRPLGRLRKGLCSCRKPSLDCTTRGGRWRCLQHLRLLPAGPPARPRRVGAFA